MSNDGQNVVNTSQLNSQRYSTGNLLYKGEAEGQREEYINYYYR